MTDDLLDVLDLGSASVRRLQARDVPLVVELVRVLTEDDIPVLLNPPAKPKQEPEGNPILRITNSHHQIARLLAVGTKNVEVAALTGHSTSYIGRLLRDPAFAELMSYYADNQDLVFVEANERMKAFGLDVLEELHQRFLADPESFSRKELADYAEMFLVKAQAARGLATAGNAARSGMPLQIGISFVAPHETRPIVNLEAVEIHDVVESAE